MTIDTRPALTLSELETFDPKAPDRRGQERRFCCPHCGDGKPHDAAHRSLSLNTETGAWHCHRCDQAGKLREFWTERPPEPKGRRDRARAELRRKMALAPEPAPPIPTTAPEAWQKQLAGVRALGGTKGVPYLIQRGIQPNVAHRAGARFSPDWYGRPAVLFPLYDPARTLHGTQGRYVDGRTDPKTRTGGAPKLGAFITPAALESDDLVIAESPLDALSLFACGVPAIGTTGCHTLPQWLAKETVGRRVWIATDADEGGDSAAEEWAAGFGWAREVKRLRPPAKDWNEALQAIGRDPLTAWLQAALNGANGNSDDTSSLPWDEGQAWADIQTAYRALGETMPAGSIPWAEEVRPELMTDADAAETALETALERQDRPALQEALRQFRAAHTAIAELFHIHQAEQASSE